MTLYSQSFPRLPAKTNLNSNEMDSPFVDPKYEFDAPMSYDFYSLQKDDSVDAWFGILSFLKISFLP